MDEEKEEESPDISDEASDESDSEDSQQRQLPAEERQETEVKSRDVKPDAVDLSNEGDSDELESISSSSVHVPAQQCVEEMETVSIGGSSQSRLLADHGIFGGFRAQQGNRAGPLITEIVMDTGNKLIRMRSAVLRVENFGENNDYILFPFST